MSEHRRRRPDEEDPRSGPGGERPYGDPDSRGEAPGYGERPRGRRRAGGPDAQSGGRGYGGSPPDGRGQYGGAGYGRQNPPRGYGAPGNRGGYGGQTYGGGQQRGYGAEGGAPRAPRPRGARPPVTGDDGYTAPIPRGGYDPRGQTRVGGRRAANPPGGPGPYGDRRQNEGPYAGGPYGEPPRRSRLEERAAARRGGPRGGGPSGPTGGPGRGGRPPGRPKTGYHRFFDYPRTNKGGFRRFLPSIKQVLGCGLFVVLAVFGFVAYAYANAPMPNPGNIKLPQATTYEYANGQQIVSLGTDRNDVQLGQVPQIVQDAFLSAEERNFYHDAGVSPTGILRAAYDDVAHPSGSLAGGSTITQQFVRQAYLTLNQTFSRKLNEIMISIKIANRYSKQEILQDYLNIVSFGRGAYGVNAAAQQYFGAKSISQITDPSRAAYIAALVNSPNNFALASDPTVDAATRNEMNQMLEGRWNYIMDGLLKMHWITPAQRAAAKYPTPIPPPSEGSLGGDVGYMVDAANWELDQEHAINSSVPDSAEVKQGGYTIVTSFDPTLMKDAERAVHDQLLTSPNLNKSQIAGLTATLASIDPSTGEVKAFYSGQDFNQSQVNNFLDGQEQPGSTFKAFTLAAALQSGISPNSVFDGDNGYTPIDPDTNQPYPDSAMADNKYVIPNEDNVSYGPRSIYYAAQESINTIFARLEMKVGFKAIDNILAACGINTNDTASLPNGTSSLQLNYPSLTLGTAGVSPMRMASAYATFASGGIYHQPITVTQVQSNGQTIWRANTTGKRTISTNVAAGVDKVFNGVIMKGTGTAAEQLTGMKNIAGKTGTTDDNMTAWFDGYSSKLATAVGMWREDSHHNLIALKGINSSDERINGADYPTHIWGEFMKLASSHIPNFEPPFPPFNDSGLNTIGATPTPTPTPTPSQTNTPPPSTPPSSSSPTPPCANSGLIGGGCQNNGGTTNGGAANGGTGGTSTGGTSNGGTSNGGTTGWPFGNTGGG